MAQDTPSTDSTSNPIVRSNTVLTRRSYVRGLAAVATTAVGTGSVIGTGGATLDYDRVEIEPGEDRTIVLEPGESLENTVFDCTAEGARVTIAAHETDWTIRNVAIEGYLDVGSESAVFGLSDREGGTSTFENVYLGDGSYDAGGETSETAIWVHPEHDGHLDVRHVNVQGFPDNGIYASAPGGAGGGTVHIDRCYAANNYVSNYRIGSAGSKVTNSSVLLDEDGYDGRGVWIWAPGECAVDGCQLETNGNHYAIHVGASGSGSSAVVSNTEYDTDFHGGIEERFGATVEVDDVGTDPEAFVPDGVPTTPEEAASES